MEQKFKTKHTPVRMCCICKKRMPKENLKRYVVSSKGALPVPDEKKNSPGRGIYVCDALECQEAMMRRTTKRKGKGQ